MTGHPAKDGPVASGRRWLRFLAASGARLSARHSLISIGFLVTHRCNLRCPYCRIAETPAAELDLDEMRSLIDRFCDLGVMRIGISGGEPLLRADLGEIVRAGAVRGRIVSVNTNGWLLAERIDAVKRADLINVSVDGPPSLHDEIRGRGSWERIVDGIEAARSVGVRMSAIVVVHSRNLPHLEETLSTIAGLGLRSYVQPVTRCDVSGDLADEWLPDAGKIRAAADMLRRNRRRLNLGNSNAFFRHMAHYPDFAGKLRCRAGETFAFVDPSGRLLPCHVHFHDSAVDLRSRSLREALAELRRPSACEGCCISPYVESSLISNLDPGSIWNAVHTIR